MRDQRVSLKCLLKSFDKFRNLKEALTTPIHLHVKLLDNCDCKLTRYMSEHRQNALWYAKMQPRSHSPHKLALDFVLTKSCTCSLYIFLKAVETKRK